MVPNKNDFKSTLEIVRKLISGMLIEGIDLWAKILCRVEKMALALLMQKCQNEVHAK